MHGMWAQAIANTEDEMREFMERQPFGTWTRNDISTVAGKIEAYVVRCFCTFSFSFLLGTGLRKGGCLCCSTCPLSIVPLQGSNCNGFFCFPFFVFLWHTERFVRCPFPETRNRKPNSLPSSLSSTSCPCPFRSL